MCNEPELGQASKALVAAKKPAKATWHAVRTRGVEKQACDGKGLGPKQGLALAHETAGGAAEHGRRSTTEIKLNKSQTAGPAGGTTENAEEAAAVYETWAKTMFN